MLNKIKLIIKNPEFLTQYCSRKNRLANILGTTKYDVRKYFSESLQCWNEIQKKLQDHGARERMSLERLQILYTCVRSFKPDVMVETGVAGGSTSFTILYAMKKNGNGSLYSIDIDNPLWHDHKNYEVGWVVPNELRSNWHLTLGDSKKELLPLLGSLKKIDIFFHDSDHSYRHMLFEFNTAFPFLESRKIILADDINLNSSLDDFVSRNELCLEKFYGFGITKSRSSINENKV